MAQKKQNNRPQQPNLQDTSGVENNKFFKGMTKDPDMVLVGKENWTHARNAINNSAKGDAGVIGNEPANLLCAEVPYDIIGGIHLFGDKWVLYSTDDESSEIGIFDDSKCEYRTFINDPCLNFDRRYLISGASKENFDCSWQVYWDDNAKNPSRTLNLGPITDEGWFTDINVPWFTQAVVLDENGTPQVVEDDENCVEYVPIEPKQLNCDLIRLAPLMKTPCIEVIKPESGGQLKNGSYQVFIAYTVNENKIGDYIAYSDIQPLWDHNDMSGSLELKISNLDTNFEFFELVVVYNHQMQQLAKRLGYYSTTVVGEDVKSISIDFIDPKLTTIPIENLPLLNPSYEKSEKMYALNDYLIRQGPFEQFDFNYQCQANDIETMWTVTQFDDTYYRRGGNKATFMRDEQYAFFIRFIYTTGEKSSSYHIPGRDPDIYPDGTSVNTFYPGGDTGSDLVATYALPGTGEDQNWQVMNTAIEVVGAPGVGDVTEDGGVVIAKGYMGYWQSSERYPSTDSTRWCDLCGDNIRHHKMPDENTCPSTRRSTLTATGHRINVLGVEFGNITRPTFNDRVTVIPNIVGYEILVGSRKGAKSIIAKGLFRNMRGYNPNVGDPETGNTASSGTMMGVFANYPFNDLHRDPYILIGDSALNSRTWQDTYSNWLGTQTVAGLEIPGYFTNLFTFHSPETSFNRPFLSPYEVKSYGPVTGNAVGRFKRSEEHPKHKLIRDIAAIIAAVVGAGYAIQEMRGNKVQKVEGGRALSVGQQAGPFEDRHYSGDVRQDDLSGSYSSYGGFWTPLGGGGASASANFSGGGDMNYDELTDQWDGTILEGDSGVNNTGTGAPMDGTAPGPAGTGGINPATGAVNNPSIIAGNATQNLDDLDEADANVGQEAAGDPMADPFNATNVANTLTSTITAPIPAPILNTVFPGLGAAVPQEQTMILATTPMNPTTSISGAEEIYMRDINQRNENAITQQNTRGYSGPSRTIESQESKYKGLPGFLQIMFKIHTFLNFMTTGGQEIIELVYNLMKDQDYVYKYNAYGLYWNHQCYYNPQCDQYLAGITNRHIVDKAIYISNAFQNLDANIRINNLQRPKTVVVDTNSPLHDIAFLGDNSRQTMGSLAAGTTYSGALSGSLVHMNPTAGFMTLIAAHYVGLKLQFENQYGQLDGILQLPSGCTTYFDDIEMTSGPAAPTISFKSPIIYGGDCYISRYSEKVIMPFFWDFLKGEPDGFNFNYYEHQNIPFTRYWYNADKYNLSGLVQPITDLTFSWLSDPSNPGLPSAMHNLDRGLNDSQFSSGEIGNNPMAVAGFGPPPGQANFGGVNINAAGGNTAGTPVNPAVYGPGGGGTEVTTQPTPIQKNGLFTIKGAAMYTHSSGINEFFVESELNIALRDWEDQRGKRHYDFQEFTDLTELFHADIIKDGNFYKYDHSLSKSNFFTQSLSFGFIQDRSYDPVVAFGCLTHYPKRVIYSLQAQKEAKKDFWRVFLPNNYRDFKNKPNVIKPISKTGALILFPHYAPQQFQGVDTLTTEGDVKITIGDAGLFNQPFQNVVNADLSHEYGSCESMRSVINTPTGLYYISQEQGKIFNYTGQLEAISDIGMKQWFNQYLPSKLLAQFPEIENYVDVDNPVVGVGCQSVYDPNYDLVYFMKKDYVSLGDPCIQFDPDLGPVINETECYGLEQTLQCPDDTFTLYEEGDIHPITGEVLTEPLCCDYESNLFEDTQSVNIECEEILDITTVDGFGRNYMNRVNSGFDPLTTDPDKTVFFTIDDELIKSIYKSKKEKLVIDLPYYNGEWLSLRLERTRVTPSKIWISKKTDANKKAIRQSYEPRSLNYRVRDAKIGDTPINKKFKGTLVVTHKTIAGSITNDGKIIELNKLKGGVYALFDFNNQITLPGKGWECFTDYINGVKVDLADHFNLDLKNRSQSKSRIASSSTNNGCLTVHATVDTVTLQNFGSVEDTVDWVISIIAATNEVYQEELGVGVALYPDVFVWGNLYGDGYSMASGNTGSDLQRMKIAHGKVQYDHMTMDELSDIVCSVKGFFSIDMNGGVGYIGGACSFHGTGQCQSQENNNEWNDAILEINGGECWTYQTDDPHNGDGYFVSGTYGFENVSADPVNEEWTTMLNGAVLAVYTHELGHNIGAWHTFQNNTYNAQDESDCTLNNVMGQDFAIIDLCASNLPSYGVTQEQWGTIMSYCMYDAATDWGDGNPQGNFEFRLKFSCAVKDQYLDEAIAGFNAGNYNADINDDSDWQTLSGEQCMNCDLINPIDPSECNPGYEWNPVTESCELIPLDCNMLESLVQNEEALINLGMNDVDSFCTNCNYSDGWPTNLEGYTQWCDCCDSSTDNDWPEEWNLAEFDCECWCREGYDMVFVGSGLPATPEDCLFAEIGAPEFIEPTMGSETVIVPGGTYDWIVNNPSFELTDEDHQYLFDLGQDMCDNSCQVYGYDPACSPWDTWQEQKEAMNEAGSYGMFAYTPQPWIRCQQDTYGVAAGIADSFVSGAPVDPITGVNAYSSDSYPTKFDSQGQQGNYLYFAIFNGLDGCEACGYCGGSYAFPCWSKLYFPYPTTCTGNPTTQSGMNDLPFAKDQSSWGADGLPGYIGLTHSAAGGFPGNLNWQEGVSQQLSQPLVAGGNYTGTIYIRKPWFFPNPDEPVDNDQCPSKILLLGGDQPCCLNETLAISPSSSTMELNEWTEWTFEFSPNGNWTYIQFMIETEDPWFTGAPGSDYSMYETGQYEFMVGYYGGPVMWSNCFPDDCRDRVKPYMMIDGFSGLASTDDTEIERETCNCPEGYQGIEWPLADGEDPIVYPNDEEGWTQFELDCIEAPTRVMCQLIDRNFEDVECVISEFTESGGCTPPVIADDVTQIELTDENYFKDVSWTISYDPKAKAWISFHDWHPDLVFPSLDHFLTTKRLAQAEIECPPDYVYNPETGMCEFYETLMEPAAEAVDYFTCGEISTVGTPIDVVFSIDISSSTGNYASDASTVYVTQDGTEITVWENQLRYVNKMIEILTPAMEAGFAQVGVLFWSKETSSFPFFNGTRGMGFGNTEDSPSWPNSTVSMTNIPWEINKDNTPFWSGNTNISLGINEGLNQLLNTNDSDLGDRSGLPSFRRIMVLVTDAEDNNYQNTVNNLNDIIGVQGTEAIVVYCQENGKSVEQLQPTSFYDNTPPLLALAGYCITIPPQEGETLGQADCSDAWNQYYSEEMRRAWTIGGAANASNIDYIRTSGNCYQDPPYGDGEPYEDYVYLSQDEFRQRLNTSCGQVIEDSTGLYGPPGEEYFTCELFGDPSSPYYDCSSCETYWEFFPDAYGVNPYCMGDIWNSTFSVIGEGPTPEALAQEVFQEVILQTEVECDCPEDYMLVSDQSGQDPQQHCVRIECSCKDVFPGVPLSEIQFTGQCSDPWGWAQDNLYNGDTYVNPNPPMCSHDVSDSISGTQQAGSIWRHNVRCDVFSNYYYIQHPWEIEFVESTGQMVNTIRNVEYEMEAYIYKQARDAQGELIFGYSDCDSRWHDLDFNFNRAYIHNTEQVSGYLHLNLAPKNNVPEINQYPSVQIDVIDNSNSFIDILYSKEEQKYRFNQFWDITANRGEIIVPTGDFDSNAQAAQQAIIWTDLNGYVRELNSLNLDYDKPPHQRKKFRHYWNKIVLGREPEIDDDGNVILETRKMLLKLDNTKINLSIR